MCIQSLKFFQLTNIQLNNLRVCGISNNTIYYQIRINNKRSQLVRQKQLLEKIMIQEQQLDTSPIEDLEQRVNLIIKMKNIFVSLTTASLRLFPLNLVMFNYQCNIHSSNILSLSNTLQRLHLLFYSSSRVNTQVSPAPECSAQQFTLHVIRAQEVVQPFLTPDGQ
ncbi:Hypothetical_protein [Hexamita inflata]|uniref:Hypothetical_protein n=1 Tax=Hexamita inflata TaxID=28002 RepID=A0AA86NWW6_9EUKA|nr:Hypothetical protein HINF_LOCUS15340 [Hexamita inflata]CAI9972571.1 Hypothetical protein HINF_LOCUS60216 [Hexamita inflata]